MKAELVEKADLALKERGALVLEFEKLVRDFEARKLSDGTIIEDLRDRLTFKPRGIGLKPTSMKIIYSTIIFKKIC